MKNNKKSYVIFAAYPDGEVDTGLCVCNELTLKQAEEDAETMLKDNPDAKIYIAETLYKYTAAQSVNKIKLT